MSDRSAMLAAMTDPLRVQVRLHPEEWSYALKLIHVRMRTLMRSAEQLRADPQVLLHIAPGLLAEKLDAVADDLAEAHSILTEGGPDGPRA